MRPVRFRSRARTDLIGILKWLEGASGSSDAATAFGSRLLAHCYRLGAVRPRMGRPRPELGPDLRSTPVGRYMIYFRYHGDSVLIVRILSAYRDIGPKTFEGERTPTDDT